MERKLQQLKKEIQTALVQATDANALADLKNKYFGRKGVLNSYLRSVKELSETERPKVGLMVNKVKEELFEQLEAAQKKFGVLFNAADDFDATLPGQYPGFGHLHPITIIQRQLEDLCSAMGFRILDGPEVESEYYNFTALNVPADHPARDAQDTFWLTDGNLLRTHTSPVQVRALQKYGAPFRGVVPGRCFRYESTDASHDHTFYQMEGLMVDRNITIANLIAVMKELLQAIFQREVTVRLRPGFFPFVEPGFELDIRCLICEGKGCSVCKRIGWVELMPCGMVHPNVLIAGKVDPKEFSGFAFGLGLTRLVMMKYGIDDIRYLLSGDLRFSEQF